MMILIYFVQFALNKKCYMIEFSLPRVKVLYLFNIIDYNCLNIQIEKNKVGIC